jgi:hypothetical protein
MTSFLIFTLVLILSMAGIAYGFLQPILRRTQFTSVPKKPNVVQSIQKSQAEVQPQSDAKAEAEADESLDHAA